MNRIIAKDGYVLTNGEVYVKEVATFGDVSMWREVPEGEKPTEQDAELAEAKAAKVAKIEDYDKSDAVNGFVYGGVSAWIAKADRVGLANSLAIEKEAGHVNTILWLNGNPISIEVDVAIGLLKRIELYALECYNATERHKANVELLESVDAVNAYDITAGYPDKLVF